MTSISQTALHDRREDCSMCPLAVYCFSDPSTWVFRTMTELEEKMKQMEECSVRKTNLKAQP